MAIAPFATWEGPTPNQGGKMLEQRGLVVHIAEGSYEGTISWCKNPASGVSCHFVTAQDGRIAQLIDTTVTAWTQIAGNGHWVSVENEGHTPGALTTAQVEANARILAWLHEVHGVPIQFVGSVSPLSGLPAGPGPNGHGLAHHSIGTTAEGWNGAGWGHSDCPGPNIQAQKQQIVARAIEIAGGDDMPFFDDINARRMAYRVEAMFADLPNEGDAGEENKLHDRLGRIDLEIAQLKAVIAGIQSGTVDQAAIEAAAREGAAAGIDGATLHKA
jgi:hypothetical protein